MLGFDGLSERTRHLLQVAAAISADVGEREVLRTQSFHLAIRDGEGTVVVKNGLAASTYLLVALVEAVLATDDALSTEVERILRALVAALREFLLPEMYHDWVWLDEESLPGVEVVLNIIGTLNQRLLNLFAPGRSSEESPWQLVEPILLAHSTVENGDRLLDIQALRGGAA